LRVSVIGLGYVGLVTSACIAEWGHEVVGTDQNPERLTLLREGRAPFHEPGLQAMVASHVASGRLRIVDASALTADWGELVIVAVGTHDGNGGWQTMTIQSCLAEILPAIPDDVPVIIRSTLPPNYVRHLASITRAIRTEAGRAPISVILNPEFTREGNAIHDFLYPDRIVCGVAHDPLHQGVERLRELYAAAPAPILTMPAIDAAFAKLGANLFLATKISFANELAALCDGYGARVDNVVSAMSYDPRIGGEFLRAGVGFGGSCLPHQVTMMVKDAAVDDLPTPLLTAVSHINDRQRSDIVGRLDALLGGISGRRIALLGLTFKPNTDDLRDAPALTIAQALIDAGASIVAYDPMPAARTRAAQAVRGLLTTDSADEALRGADAAALLTEWPEFAEVDWVATAQIMRQAIIFDGRNVLVPERLTDAGFTYAAFGRQGALEESTTPVEIVAGGTMDLHLGQRTMATQELE
jgi:UDPglucose 6-dehydrogenase